MKMSSRSKNEDRLSSLPEEVLSHILSLMPTIYAVQNCILSKRWRYTWKLVTNLDFDDFLPARNLSCFSTYVDRVFERRKTLQLNSFRLGLEFLSLQKPKVSNWINKAVKLNVSELDIGVMQTELPVSLYTCKTLTKLRLVLSTDDLDVFDGSPSVMLPGLKTLDFRVNSRPSVNISKFIHGCPILESLCLEIRWPDNELYLNIPTLKRLELGETNVRSSKVFLNVPNLKYLYVGGDLHPQFVMEDLPSLVAAIVCGVREEEFSVKSELLIGLSGVKSLSWSHSVFNISGSPLPNFPNLKHLELKGSFRSQWLLVIQILKSSPVLEHLSFEEPEESGWIEPQSVPICMLSNLKTVRIAKSKGRECDIQFLKFMLGNAEVLKMLTIICGKLKMMEEMGITARLLKFQRASRFCEIHFVGKWLNSVGNY